MAEALKWNEQLEIGVMKFDDQHKKLIELLNELYDAMQKRKEKEILNKVVRSVINYTMEHFNEEERTLLLNNYPDFAAHKIEHEKLKGEVNTFMTKYRDNEVTPLDFFNFLKGWIVNHILVTDKKYPPYIKKF